MKTTIAYILMVHTLGSSTPPYWRPAQWPPAAYADADACVKRAVAYMAMVPDAIFGCPMLEVR